VGFRREVLQGKNLARAAEKAGVEHFVYGSVGGAERNTGISPWETKWEIERYIRQLRLPVTILRPVAFMETYHMLEVEVRLFKGQLVHPVRGDKAFQTIATDDIGAFAALAFERPEEFMNSLTISIGSLRNFTGLLRTRLNTPAACRLVSSLPAISNSIPIT